MLQRIAANSGLNHWQYFNPLQRAIAIVHIGTTSKLYQFF